MRPVKLTMTAFGPYRDRETIDFGELRGNDLFLINGSTGAGKTVIFDAICYALYGSIDRERTPEMLRCNQAAPEQVTTVELVFELRGETYYIWRKPAQLRPPRRGDKSRLIWDSAGVRLYRGGDDRGEYIDRRTIDEVNKWLVDKLGFDRDQFRRVVLLPQGRFQEFLKANTNEKSDLLRKIIDTGFYDALMEKLGSKAKVLQKEVEQLAERRQNLLATVKGGGVADGGELAARIESQALELKTCGEKLTAQRKAVQERQQALDAAVKLAGEFAAADKAKIAADNLAAQVPAMTELAERLKMIRAARLLLPVAQQVRERKEEWENAVAQEKAAAEVLDGCKRDSAAAEQAAARDNSPAAKEQTEAMQAELVRLTGYSQPVEQHQTAVAALAETAARLAETEKQEEKLAEKLLRCQEEQKGLLEKRENLQRLAACRELREKQLAEARAAQTDSENYKRARQELENARQELKVAQGSYQTAAERAEKQKIACARLERQWHLGQAAILARDVLKEDEPCPVCGSTHHPRPCVGAEQLPSQADVDKARQTYETAENDRRSAEEYLHRREREADKSEGGLAALPVPSSDDPAAIVAAARRQYDEAVAAGKKLATEIEPALEKLTINLEDVEREKQAATERIREAQLKLKENAAAMNTLQVNLPERYRDAAGLEKLAADRENLSRSIKLRIENAKRAETAQRQAAEALTKARADWTAAGQRSADAAEKYQRARADFVEQGRKQGFADEAAHKSAAADIDRSDEWERKLNEFERERHAADAGLREKLAAVAGQSRPDVAGAQTLYNEAQELVENYSREQGKYQEHLAYLETIRTELSRLEARQAAKEASLIPARNLADAANGDNGAKINFRNYMLRIFLDEVVEMANDRLRLMTDGHYELRRTDARTTARAHNVGLELEVYDSYVGQNRHIATLSGGESFLASLALALGLADVVQQYTGGVQLDTVFIDEGFGTLDEESLDQVMGVLNELRSTGRLVGLISHVELLRERIPVRLDVSKNRQGIAHTRFVIDR